MSEQVPPETRSATVCVVGLGYVGLPLAVAFDEADLSVVGYDVDTDTVDALADGRDPTGDVGGERVGGSDVTYTTDPEHLAAADYVVVTVPTPLDDHDGPDFEFVGAAGETVGTHVTPGTTVVLESTVYPGATEEVLVPVLEAASGHVVGEDLEVGYSSERISPGDESRSVADVTKVVGGRTPAVGEDLAALYRTVVDAGIHVAPDIMTAEASKLVENAQRDVNIALVNEVARICDALGLDSDDVLEAAGTKWNFHDEYSPGLVGGHCIPVDPHYLRHAGERAGVDTRLLPAAREVNDRMPSHVADLVVRALNDAGKVLRESRVLVLGLAYKPGVNDLRASAHERALEDLAAYGVALAGHDPHASEREVRSRFDIDYQADLDFEGFDGVLVGTAHEAYRALGLDDLRRADGTRAVVDVPGVFDARDAGDDGPVYRCL